MASRISLIVLIATTATISIGHASGDPSDKMGKVTGPQNCAQIQDAQEQGSEAVAPYISMLDQLELSKIRLASGDTTAARTILEDVLGSEVAQTTSFLAAFIHHQLGHICLLEEKPGQALSHYATVLEGAPSSASAMNNVAYTVSQLSQPDQAQLAYAESLIDLALSTDPENGELHLTSAAVAVKSRRYGDAIDDSFTALVIFESNIATVGDSVALQETTRYAHSLISESYFALGDSVAANFYENSAATQYEIGY